MITYSHFLARIDLMPGFISGVHKVFDPILVSVQLDRDLRPLKANIHVYGHSHVNRHVEIDGVAYVNNAFGYSNEIRITAKRLICVHDC